MGMINRPIIAEIAPNTYHINEFGVDCQYLLIGEERALLIDTGTGLYDVKKTVETLTNKPYDVVVTHMHGDHNGGSDQFETVWMHPADIALVPGARAMGDPEAVRRKLQRMEEMKTVGHYETGTFGYNWPRYDHIFPYETLERIVPEQSTVYQPLQDGQVFELGKRPVTVYHTPGHTPGSVSLLDHKRRILFAGDAMNSNVGTRSVGGAYSGVAVSTMLRGLLRIQAMRDQYDQTFTGHVAYANTVDIFSQPAFVLDDVIENLRRLLNGTAEIIQMPSHLKPELVMPTAIYRTAATIFNPDLLWEEGEEHIVP